MINETIWLEVSDEEKIPMAENEPLRKINPMYEPQIAPESKLPFGEPSA